MSKAASREENADFLHFFQKFKFQEDSHNHITAAGNKRMQIILNYYQSLKNGEENATGYLLENDLKDYVETVDDKTGLNNYAQYIKCLSSLSRNSVSDCRRWNSSLESQDIPGIDSKLSCPLNNDEKNIENLYRNLMKKSSCMDERLGNVKISQPEKTNDIYNSRNENGPPYYNAETITTKSNISSSNSFTFKKPSIAPAHLPQNRVNSNRRMEVNEHQNSNDSSCGFRTAKTELKIQSIKKNSNRRPENSQPKESFSVKRSLGGRTRTVNSKFIPPIKNEDDEKNTNDATEEEICEDERLKNLDPKMIELIKNEIMDNGNPITWDDIAGLQFAKTTIQEIVVWPLLRPDIFTGLRRPPKGILLFGPPGTGKTLIGKCIASQSSSTFFSISASSLTSKWIGDSEKLVRTLFAVARCYQPAVIFIDEIDSLLSQRSETEHESSRRIKTEFLVQLDGATTHDDDRILVIGATNRPQELDEAARRRLVKRLYIPLPEYEARCQIVNRLMKTERNELREEDVHEIAKLTDGYSGADMKNLCQEASLGPIRSIDFRQIGSIESHEVRPVNLSDFVSALKVVRSSVSPSDLKQYLEWDKIYGSSGN